MHRRPCSSKPGVFQLTPSNTFRDWPSVNSQKDSFHCFCTSSHPLLFLLSWDPKNRNLFSVLIVFHAMQLQRSGEGHQQCCRVPLKSRAKTVERKAHLDQLRRNMEAQSLPTGPAPNYSTCPGSLCKLSSEVGVWRHGEWFLLCLLDKRLVIVWPWCCNGPWLATKIDLCDCRVAGYLTETKLTLVSIKF